MIAPLWTQADAGTVIEPQATAWPLTAANAECLISALEARGVEFLSDEDSGPGVRLRLNPPPRFGK